MNKSIPQKRQSIMKYNRASIMSRAHELRKIHRCSMADALRLAWGEVLGERLFVNGEEDEE